jgi:hypothetical protein
MRSTIQQAASMIETTSVIDEMALRHNVQAMTGAEMRSLVDGLFRRGALSDAEYRGYMEFLWNLNLPMGEEVDFLDLSRFIYTTRKEEGAPASLVDNIRSFSGLLEHMVDTSRRAVSTQAIAVNA